MPNKNQPPSASDERERFEALYPMPQGCVRLSTGYAGSSYKAWETHHYMGKWEGWQARAALAPSPGVDAAGQKLVADDACYLDQYSSRVCELGTRTCTRHHAAPSPAASPDEWMAEAVRLVDAYTTAIERLSARVTVLGPAAARAALLAHLKARP